MNTTSLETIHAPSHLREQFRDWLDSYEPNRLHEIDTQPVASLLDALADCGDVLPADYCDQLEISKGSTYAQAVADVRQQQSEETVLTLDYVIAHLVELDRRLGAVGDDEFEAAISHLGQRITIWRHDDVDESTYGWNGVGKQNGEVLDSLEECLEDCRKALADGLRQDDHRTTAPATCKMKKGTYQGNRPTFLGVAILARQDPNRPFLMDNCYWRTAVSEEEARQGSELHVGADLRDRFFELEREGWFQIAEDKRQELMRLG